MRGRFSLTKESQQALLDEMKRDGVASALVLSTCNRTEIYGFAAHPYVLVKYLCQYSNGSLELFERVAHIAKGREAIHHLFRVGSGLDSQILGDFEIIGQLKGSFRLSKSKDLVDAFLEASKRIKNETRLSSGSASLAFAATRHILQCFDDCQAKRILLFGTGKIGSHTCENLLKHVPQAAVTLINRTRQSAEAIAAHHPVEVEDYADLDAALAQSDVVVVATGAREPTVSADQLPADKPLLILDLSMPRNVAPEVAQLPNLRLLHIDQLSDEIDKTLAERKSQVPLAERIQAHFEAEFVSWIQIRKWAPAIASFKDKLAEIQAAELAFQSKKAENFDWAQADLVSSRLIDKITAQYANHLKRAPLDSDDSIALFNAVFGLEPVEEKPR